MKTKGPLEAVIERKLRDYSKELGYVCYKFVSPGNRGVPDRIFINKHGVTIYIEVKRLGATTNANQDKQLRKLREQMAPVFVVDNVEFGCQVLDAWRDRLDPRL